MDNVVKRAVTYSVLAHIREGGGVVKSNIDTFAPLVKKSLAYFANGQEVKSNTTIDIKNFITNEFGISIPLPVVNTILDKVAKEIVSTSDAKCQLFGDGAFIIESYDFDVLDNIHTSHTEEIRELEEIFNAFCSEEALSGKDYSNVFTFIESSQSSIGQYLTEDEPVRELRFTAEARFVEYVKDIPSAYATVRKIYIGSLLVSYIKYPASEAKVDMELVFDTNFLIGLLNLSTEESNETCQTLLSIGGKQGFTLTVLQDTIDETENLLRSKARDFGVSFLTNKIYPEDIYNACDRLSYGTADLERIADNLTSLITRLGVQLIPHTEAYRNKAKFSSEYTRLKVLRQSDKAARHDATVIEYVKAKRNKPIREFYRVNCWFVNNSNAVNRAILTSPKDGKQPNIIRASDLLNILWLSNPGIQESVNSADIAENGLTSMISLAVMPELPRKKTIRELEANIRKYASEELTDTDIVRLANRITANGINDLEGLNSIARTSNVEFVQRLKEESTKQEKVEADQSDRLERAIAQLTAKSEKADQLLESYEKAKGEIPIITEQMASRLKEAQQELSDSQEELRLERLKPDVARYKTSRLRRRQAGAIGVAASFIVLFLLFNNYVDMDKVETLTGLNDLGGIVKWGAGVLGLWFCVKPIYNLCFDDNYMTKFKSEVELPDRLK